MNITRMGEQWIASRIQQKGDSKCVPWKSLRDLVLVHPAVKKRVDVFALGIYGLVIFPKALGHIDEAVSDLFDRLSKGVTPVPAILTETFRSLNACRRADEDVEWRAPWMILDEILYQCGDFDWVPLLEIWGAFGYAPLLVSRQYRSRQFIPAMQGLAQCEFSYKGDNYKKKVRKMSNAWNQTRRMKILAVDPSMTPEYSQWRDQRVNDNIPGSGEDGIQSIEEHLQVVPSKLKIIKQDFEKRSSEWGNKIEQLEEEKMRSGLDVDIYKLEAEKLMRGKNKADEDLNSLKMDYKRLRLSMRTVDLGKTSE
ncbi:hypothetical protein Gogos_022025 [Gossypium gossypioides]|uniref:DUF7745 domain-containing protein n=3 Tax=Gossypium gossypioides TaxID=34282 RepID=A0A7J9D1Y7_GOSGO|nr:hypothetical protein [Gossypium gossypioides]